MDMADPVSAAAAAAANDEDVEDLYADLDDHVAAALAAVGESGGSIGGGSDPANDGDAEVSGDHTEADANEAVDLGDVSMGYISSDEESEDDIHILLNEDDSAPPPPPAGRCEERWVEREEGDVSGSCVEGPSINDVGRGKIGGLHSKGLLEKTIVPTTGQGDQGHHHAFQRECSFFLPRNMTVFDLDIEAFQHKPWRQHGVDLTDYFNFGLDEEGWRRYCVGMEHYRLGARTLANESSGLEQGSHYNLGSSKLVLKSVTYPGLKESNELAKPKGRAIHVEGGMHERLPSADMWPPRQRDSDVIQVNVMLSPSNHSTSDDSSTVNHKCETTNRLSSNHPGVDKCLKETSFVMDRVIGKEVHTRGSAECAGNKLVLGDSVCARVQASSSDYSDMPSEESTEDCCFKRTRRNSNYNAFYVETNHKDEHALSVFCHHSSKSDQESSKGESHRYHKITKCLRTDEAGGGMSSRFLNNCRSERHLLKYGHKATKELKKQSLSGGSRALFLFEKEENTKDNYSSRYAGKYKHKISSSSSLGNNYRVNNQSYQKQEYLPLERVAFRNYEQHSSDSNHGHKRSWHEINDDKDIVDRFSPAKHWQQGRDHVHGCNSMLKAELYDDINEQMYRERLYQEAREVRYGDDEFFHHTDYRSGKLLHPEVRRRYRKQSAEISDEHFRHPDHLMLSRQANDNLKKYEKDRPPAGLNFMSSRNRFIDDRKFQHSKMKYDCDGYYNNKAHNYSAFGVDNIQRSAMYTGSIAETGQCIRPMKRKAYADLGSMNHKDLFSSSYPKGRRLMHNQSMISDRKLYPAEIHNSPKEIDVESICSLNDTRNSNIVPNIYDERRHEFMNLQSMDADSFLLNHREKKVKRQGIKMRREVENDSEGCLPEDRDLLGSKYNNVHKKACKPTRSYHTSANQVWEKSTSTQQKQQYMSINEEYVEIEEGELIEQDHQDTVSKSKVDQPRKVVLKSVIEACSASQGGVINATSKDAVCSNGATRECDNKHILEVMKKMQKRRERFKEPIAPQKEDDGYRKELLVLSCNIDIKNQRPARKQRWGCSR